MDVTFTNKAWIELQRYHFIDIITGMSSMHRISRFDLTTAFNEYVDKNGIHTIEKAAELGYYHELFSFGMRDIQMMEIRHYSLPVVSAGFDALGNYYLQSSNYYAKITPTQYDLFIKICTEGEKDNNQYAYERLELYKSIKR